MNIEKIEINGHYVWVNKDAEIKEGDWYYDSTDKVGLKPIYQRSQDLIEEYYGCYKIIAASPELNLEEVPTYVEWLAEKFIGCKYEDIEDNIDQIGYDSFIRGYQKAEKELPTWDDVRKAIELAKNGYIDFNQNNEPLFDFIHSEEEIIEQLKQLKK